MKEFPVNNRPSIHHDVLYKLYVIDNKTISDISKELGYGYRTISTALKYFSIDSKNKRKPRLHQYTNAIIELYHTGSTLSDIGNQYGVSYLTIRNLLVNSGIVIRPTHQYNRAKNDISYSDLHDAYIVKQKSQTAIASEFSININRVKHLLDFYNIQIRPQKACLDIDIVNDYEQNLNVNQIAEKRNITLSTVYRVLGNAGYKFDGNTSYGEMEIAEFINSLGFNTEQSVTDIIQPYELDIVIPEKKIAIEYNGLYWHSSKFKSAYYHKTKTKNAYKKGYRLIHIFEDEWKLTPEIVKAKLTSILGCSTKQVYARKCTITTPSISEQKEFMDKHHIQGYQSGSICYSLTYGNSVVAMMNFKKTKTVNSGYKLERYCTSLRVVGGFSKLLSKFIKTHNPAYIETFADLRWSSIDSNVYSSNGFILDSVTSPNYFYVRSTTLQRKSRNQFMKHLLPNKLDIFDHTLTEKENMLNNGYYQIHDCGNMKFIWGNTQ